MGKHDKYGKMVLRAAVGRDFVDTGSQLRVDYDGIRARLDGAVRDEVAIEIESRVDKQIRGSVLDLICHPYPKKLLIIIPAHMEDN